MNVNPIIDVPRPTKALFDVASRRARRRALDELLAFETLGASCTYRIIAEDGLPVPADQITDRDRLDISTDLQHLARRGAIELDVLLALLYEASAHEDRSKVGPALDRLLEYVDYWTDLAPDRVDALFENLDPSKLRRAVGQTLLAATRLDGFRSAARQSFYARFIDDLRTQGTPEATIRRLTEELKT